MANSDSLPARKETEKGERTLYSSVFKHWGGCYTRSARTAMPKDRWYHLENLQPIGDANIHTINNISGVLYDFASDNIYAAQYANIGGIDYIYSFATNGKVFQTKISDNTTTQINVGQLFSGNGSSLDQWKNLVVLFIDSTGLYSWNGTTLTHIVVAGAPPAGQAIAVYQGRVWVANGRIVYYSVPADTNGTNTGYGNAANDFNAANGAGFFLLTDPQVRVGVTRMLSANGYLYIFGPTSINVVADVYVPSGATPPTPVFTNLNIQAIIGTDQPAAVFPYNRNIIFGNRYGAYALSGTTAQKISDDIDGTWQYLQFSQPLSGGQVVVNNILTAAILLFHAPDPEFSFNTIIAMWWDGKWWFANYGALTFVFSAYAQNQVSLFGLKGNKLYQLFFDPNSSPDTEFVGPLWDMDDPIRGKEVIKAGIEASVLGTYGQINLNLDTATSSKPLTTSGSLGSINWQNNFGVSVTWLNNSAAAVSFFTPGYILFAGAAPGGFSKYVGLSGTTTGTQYQLSALMMDYAFTNRW
jgi:hypothetical protein